MRVLLLNGSPHARGCTHTALTLLADALTDLGVTADLFHIGNPLGGCRACGMCKETHLCTLGDSLNEALGRAAMADGYIFGTPVHYAAASGGLTGFLDRFFYAGKPIHTGKFGAAVAVGRRAGGTSAIDQLLRYFPLASMTAVSAGYWNVLYGTTPEEIAADTEGVRNLLRLARAIACFRPTDTV